MEYTDWQKRVIDEKIELDKKIEKIQAFMKSDEFDNLSVTERALIHKQWVHMCYYSEALNDRMTLFMDNNKEIEMVTN
jgi:hypothetical protein